MKIIPPLTFVIILAGLFSNMIIVGHYSTTAVEFVWIPYVILIGLMFLINVKKGSSISQLAALIATCAFAILSSATYYEVSYATSHKSTEALIFFILPFLSIGLIPILFLISKLLIMVIMRIMKTNKQIGWVKS